MKVFLDYLATYEITFTFPHEHFRMREGEKHNGVNSRRPISISVVITAVGNSGATIGRTDTSQSGTNITDTSQANGERNV